MAIILEAQGMPIGNQSYRSVIVQPARGEPDSEIPIELEGA